MTVPPTKRENALASLLVEVWPPFVADGRQVADAILEYAAEATPPRQHVYQARSVLKVTDGDTFWLNLDVGFRHTHLTQIRLDGFDTPEKRQGSEHEKEEAQRARELTEVWLDTAILTASLWVQTRPDPDNFGRWLGTVWMETPTGPVHLGEWLRDNRLASRWPTRWRDEFETSAGG